MVYSLSAFPSIATLTDRAGPAHLADPMVEPIDDPDCDHEAVTQHPAATDPVHVERAAALFRAAGDPARLVLLERLSHGECCVTELAELFGEGMSTVSQRLRLLRSERLVERRREGKHIYYSLADRHVAVLIQSALEHVAETGRS
ncbi:MAG: helix-turn-helix transcriptional regulator [Myxococcales bacterium]|nr:helix-turn-helix transcriptional regulator [Myxococcales bacterium]